MVEAGNYTYQTDKTNEEWERERREREREREEREERSFIDNQEPDTRAHIDKKTAVAVKRNVSAYKHTQTHTHTHTRTHTHTLPIIIISKTKLKTKRYPGAEGSGRRQGTITSAFRHSSASAYSSESPAPYVFSYIYMRGTSLVRPCLFLLHDTPIY